VVTFVRNGIGNSVGDSIQPEKIQSMKPALETQEGDENE
jgi:hypothetical protein